MRICAVLTLMVLDAVAIYAQPRSVQPTWSLDLLAGTASISDSVASRISSTAWSSTGKCVAVSTADTVDVIDANGSRVWKWEFGRNNRLIRAGSLAVSPSCDAIAIVGDPDYKYVWIAQRSGARAFFKTNGTPWVVRFSLSGDVVAVTTGASLGYLFSRRAEVLWSGRDRDLPLRGPSKVGPSDRMTASQTEFAREDVDTLFQGPFSSDGSMRSDDGRWTVNWGEPPHGPGNGLIQLFGPGDRIARWNKVIDCPSALILPGADRIIALGDLKSQDDTESSCEHRRLYVFDQEGRMLQSAPVEGVGYLLGATPNGRVFVYQQKDQIQGLDPSLKAVWVITTPREHVVRPSPDRRMFLVHEPSGHSITLYHVE